MTSMTEQSNQGTQIVALGLVCTVGCTLLAYAHRKIVNAPQTTLQMTHYWLCQMKACACLQQSIPPYLYLHSTVLRQPLTNITKSSMLQCEVSSGVQAGHALPSRLVMVIGGNVDDVRMTNAQVSWAVDLNSASFLLGPVVQWEGKLPVGLLQQLFQRNAHSTCDHAS